MIGIYSHDNSRLHDESWVEGLTQISELTDYETDQSRLSMKFYPFDHHGR